MAWILSIETSTKVCSVALHFEGKLQSVTESFVPNSHSERINFFIHEVLEKAGISFAQLQAICISSGPGSYTGLRIGTSTAKGLCYALQIPLLAVNALQGMALQAINDTDGLLRCPMIDARRMEVYCALYDAHGNELQPPVAKIIDEHSFLETLKTSKVLFYGDGAEKCKAMITHPNAQFRGDIGPTATSMGQQAYRQFVQGVVEDVAYFEPFYLKEFHTVPSKKNLLQR